MITDQKLTVYQRFDGDIDGWARAATPHEKALMTDEDWADIAELLLRLAIVKSGQAADVYDDETKRIISAKVENEEVAKRLQDCARARGQVPTGQNRGAYLPEPGVRGNSEVL